MTEPPTDTGGDDSNREQALLRHLIEYAEPTTTAPSRAEVRQADALPHPHVYERHFGTVANAAEASGLDPRYDPSEYTYTERDLIRLLRELADDLGETPSARQVREADELPDTTTYQRRFGSWNDALEAAELDSTRSQVESK